MITTERLSDLTQILACIDHTSLEGADTSERIKKLCQMALKPGIDLPSTAGVCVYPIWVHTAANYLQNTGLKITSVVSGFPSGATYLEVRVLETQMAIQAGATEVDMVISRGMLIQGDDQHIFEEVKAIRTAAKNVTLKVILETGELSDPSQIHNASMIAMEAGADFIKTSTGKIQPAATLDSARIMLEAIASFQKQSGKKIGFKAAGGIRTASESLAYFDLTKEILDDSWLNPTLFRIGASSLTSNLANAITELKTNGTLQSESKLNTNAY